MGALLYELTASILYGCPRPVFFFIPNVSFLGFLSNSEKSDRFPYNGGNRCGYSLSVFCLVWFYLHV